VLECYTGPVEQRLQREAYVRQLRRMAVEFDRWATRYDQEQAHHQDDWLGTRYVQRAAELRAIIQHLVAAADLLRDLSRVR
jgi:hypothetical protein